MFGSKYNLNVFNVAKSEDTNEVGQMLILVYIWITAQYTREAVAEVRQRIARGTAPDGVTTAGLTKALEYESVMADCVKDITQDAIKERHMNGLAKQWGQAVLELLRLGLLLQYKDGKQKDTLSTWKARSGGKIRPKQQSLLLYPEILQT